MIPSTQPTSVPSCQPTNSPTSTPSCQPTNVPTSFPSMQPSNQPIAHPSRVPTSQPSSRPSFRPTVLPTCQPTVQPSHHPSTQPSAFPSAQPSSSPTSQPSDFPSKQPSCQPSCKPTVQPTSYPSHQPSSNPSNQPTTVPTMQPSVYPSSLPSSFPSEQPTNQPSSKPTVQPTYFPTSHPSNKPSSQPSLFPSSPPTTVPSRKPSMRPSSQPTGYPTNQPSSRPTSFPSTQPTCQPSGQPSSRPSNQPTEVPSNRPSNLPTNQPSSPPTSLPSGQPTSSPSFQPLSSPTHCPFPQPTMIPTTQPFAFPTSAPVATIYQTNGVLFWLGITSPISNKTQDAPHSGVLGTSYILFGRNFNHQSRFPFTMSLSSSSSREFVSKISSNEGGILNDVTTRSTTIIGDINDDDFLDLIVCYPLASKCSVYLGNGVDDFSSIIATAEESFTIVGDPYDGGGFLGWSSIRIGDLNGDGFDEIIISAINANTIYVVYGKRNFEHKIKVSELRSTEGFKIIGHPNEINFGVSITLLHDFRRGSRADIAITAQTASSGQNVIYILFGAVVFKACSDVYIEQISNNSNACFKIITPTFSYAGFSIAGIGDINSDGYDDLAVGSVPYYRGKYTEQRTFVIYGRSVVANSINEFQLVQMSEKDGFIITGGGFLVTGVGDVNSDSINDLMITSYYDWKGQGCGYLIMRPPNMTYAPSLQPSSRPTATIITYSPSSKISNTSAADNSSAVKKNFTLIPLPTLQPSRISSFVPNSGPTKEPSRLVFAVGSSRPSHGKPSILEPTINPTSGYHLLRGFPPSEHPMMMPTINNTDYIEIDCAKSGNYHGGNETNYKFSITASIGVLSITGNDDGEAKNLYVLYCPTGPVDVIIKNFRLGTDIISVAHLSEARYSYLSLNEIPYSLKSGPLTLFFCADHSLQVTFTSHTSFDLLESNFVFILPSSGKQDSSKDSESAQVQIGIAFGVLLLFCFILYVTKAAQDIIPRKKSSHVCIGLQKDDENSRLTTTSSLADLFRDWQSSPGSDVEDSNKDDEMDSSLDSNSFSISTIGASVSGDEERSESLGSGFIALLLKMENNDSGEESMDLEDSADETNGSSGFYLSDEEISLEGSMDSFEIENTEESTN
jgi:hypothetical protein